MSHLAGYMAYLKQLVAIFMEKVKYRLFNIKAEYLNPGYSVKDRAGIKLKTVLTLPAKYMIEAAVKDGTLKPNGTIVEATAGNYFENMFTGNTGIGLALYANSKGYKTLFVCPDKVSTEKVETLRTLGATVEVVPSVPLDNPNHFQRVFIIDSRI